MKISTITNWAYGVTLVLTILSGGAMFVAVNRAEGERIAVQDHLAISDAANDLAVSVETITAAARLYVMRGEERFLKAFNSGSDDEHRGATHLKMLADSDPSADEKSILESLPDAAGALDTYEADAINLYRNGDAAGARSLLFSDEHERHESDLLNLVRQLRALVTARTQGNLDKARLQADIAAMAARIMLGLTAAVFLGVLYFILKRRVATPLTTMSGIVNRLAQDDFAVDVPLVRQHDEIGAMSEAINIFRVNGLERERLHAEQTRDQQRKDLILQMMHRVQACQTHRELAEVVARFIPQVFPSLAGRLHALSDDRKTMESLSEWSAPVSGKRFSPDCCWGLRRGRPHVSNRNYSDVCCQHLTEGGLPGLCIPLSAQGETVGLLYLEEHESEASALDTARLYLEIIAENLGLAIANLHMRDRLTLLASRDGLTGLLNRRALDAALADAGHGVLSALMIDIDHFKRFNDLFSHEAGDAVMQTVARLLDAAVAGKGSTYRYGGEEFTVLLPGRQLAAAFDCAETIRQTIATTSVAYRGQAIGPVTVSIGVASTTDGEDAPLLAKADAALLRAKQAGRNRTLLSTEPG
ncbi:diguanylate cyclase (GGDEF) domain-containing protein [Rhizobium sp. RU20A]|uniref:diguanylate cyclase n=1 Tax=Rhizobium sp. RU20A TaxID=1907412 RepID=UPI0009557D48|nr:diguanylate cyclase [Rhizobium sp. RU20A]SIP94759.1 diguanylate cyclase (GGDEF) domain-containing protein [Rhizobium sp. RU20A]